MALCCLRLFYLPFEAAFSRRCIFLTLPFSEATYSLLLLLYNAAFCFLLPSNGPAFFYCCLFLIGCCLY